MSRLSTIADKILQIESTTCQSLSRIDFSDPVTHVYNPLDYAHETHSYFIKKYCNGGNKKILFLGMNPGPFGMAQNGVPFGEANIVREWFNVKGTVKSPAQEHPKRPITGLKCTRSEVSGKRFWGFFKTICGTPENFFKHCFMYNYCPLVFMAKSGKNVTPNKLVLAERKALIQICDQALRDMVRLLHIDTVVGVGRYAEDRALSALHNINMSPCRTPQKRPIATTTYDRMQRDLTKVRRVLFDDARYSDRVVGTNHCSSQAGDNSEFDSKTATTLKEDSPQSSYLNIPDILIRNGNKDALMVADTLRAKPRTCSVQLLDKHPNMANTSVHNAYVNEDPQSSLCISETPLNGNKSTSTVVQSPEAKKHCSKHLEKNLHTCIDDIRSNEEQQSSCANIPETSMNGCRLTISKRLETKPDYGAKILDNIPYTCDEDNILQKHHPAMTIDMTPVDFDSVKIFAIMHPSPANPKANKGWDNAVYDQLKDQDLLQYFVSQ